MSTDYDARYAEPGYAYGTEPNDFLVECASYVPNGPVLCLAEGQGRNAVFLAGRGHSVVAVDRSPVGLAKARDLARARGVPLTCVVSDLDDYPMASTAWAGIVSIFGHVPVELRERLHQQVVRALMPGGVLILEAYTPAQLGHATGGPKDLSLLMTVEALRRELSGLEILIGREVEREVVEGRYHTGRAAVVQVLARRAAPARPLP